MSDFLTQCRAVAGRRPRTDRSRRYRALPDRLAPPFHRPGAGGAETRHHRGGGGDREIVQPVPGADRAARRQHRAGAGQRAGRQRQRDRAVADAPEPDARNRHRQQHHHGRSRLHPADMCRTPPAAPAACSRCRWRRKAAARIGGNLSTNAGGTARAALRQYARTVPRASRWCTPQGEIWNGLRGLRKDNTGYDLRDLFIGAEGTLGVITGGGAEAVPAAKGATDRAGGDAKRRTMRCGC